MRKQQQCQVGSCLKLEMDKIDVRSILDPGSNDAGHLDLY